MDSKNYKSQTKGGKVTKLALPVGNDPKQLWDIDTVFS